MNLSKQGQGKTVAVAIIDGPYDGYGLSQVLAKPPIELGGARCTGLGNRACNHGTFIMGLLGARRDAAIPGLCPDCQLLHVSLFDNHNEVSAGIDDLAKAIVDAVTAGALIINLSLAILGEESGINPGLDAALDYAEASGVILVVAVGNQGRLASGQILAHSATIPVAATDGRGRLLPECNFGPLISRRGFAALGHEVLGYSPGLGRTTMSGTSVAAAMATGAIADVWHSRSEASAKEIFLALSRLAPSDVAGLPLLGRDVLRDALDGILSSALPMEAMDVTSKFSFHGEKAMALGVNRHTSEQRTAVLQSGITAMPTGIVLACACGNSGSSCTCHEKQGPETDFAYAIGTVEVQYPSVAVEREMQVLAKHLGVESEPNGRPTENRNWQHAVLSRDRKLSRYLARQLSWRLTIEDGAAFVLSPRDPADFEDLIDCLDRPKFSQSGHLQDLDVVIGVTGSRSSAGIEVKMDQVFTIRPEQLSLWDGGEYIGQLADNRGLTDEERAYNYLIARYDIEPALRALDKEFELSGVPTLRSRLSADNRRVVRVIYTFNGRGRNIPLCRKYFVRVDVTEEFPFIVTPWNRYLERGEEL